MHCICYEMIFMLVFWRYMGQFELWAWRKCLAWLQHLLKDILKKSALRSSFIRERAERLTGDLTPRWQSLFCLLFWACSISRRLFKPSIWAMSITINRTYRLDLRRLSPCRIFGLNGQFHVSEEFLPMCEKLCYSATWFGTPCKRRFSQISY